MSVDKRNTSQRKPSWQKVSKKSLCHSHRRAAVTETLLKAYRKTWQHTFLGCCHLSGISAPCLHFCTTIHLLFMFHMHVDYLWVECQSYKRDSFRLLWLIGGLILNLLVTNQVVMHVQAMFPIHHTIFIVSTPNVDILFQSSSPVCTVCRLEHFAIQCSNHWDSKNTISLYRLTMSSMLVRWYDKKILFATNLCDATGRGLVERRLVQGFKTTNTSCSKKFKFIDNWSLLIQGYYYS